MLHWKTFSLKVTVCINITIIFVIQKLHSAQTKHPSYKDTSYPLYWTSLHKWMKTWHFGKTIHSLAPHLPTYSYKELKSSWKWKSLKMKNITGKYFFTALWTHTCISVKVKERRRGNFSRVTALVLAVGSVLTFNPGWVTGVRWCAEEGQEGTLLPRPLRSHVGNSWAAPDSRVRGNVAGSTGLPLGEPTHS